MNTTPASGRATVGQGVGRRIYRGLAFALMVGGTAAAISAVPALFIQSIFVGEAQRCEEAERKDIAVSGEVRTDCAQEFADAPFWLPTTLIVSGAAAGAVGGFGYGFIRPRSSPASGPGATEEPWLPF